MIETLKLRSRTVTPPGGFIYVDPETHHIVSAVSWNEWLEKIKSHRKANNLPIPLNFEDSIEHRLCETLPPEICARQNPEEMARAERLSSGLTLDAVMKGAATLARWFFAGMPLVESAMAVARARICAGCNFNRDFDGCQGCNGGSDLVKSAVDKLVGGKKTIYDERLKHCLVCKCSNRAKVQIPHDIILKNTSEQELADLPEHCWILKERAV